jgi:hypothetical protein
MDHMTGNNKAEGHLYKKMKQNKTALQVWQGT